MDQPVRELSLLLTSPRVAPGLLSAAAWQALRSADHVLAADPQDPTPRALLAAEVPVRPATPSATPQERAAELLALDGIVVWVGSPDGDPGLAEALAVQLPEEDPPTLELLVGSWDTPGARLLDAVAVMDRLRSPGGCPWDAEQTHASLVPYLVEEAHEAAEVLDELDSAGGDAREHAVDELGDVLLQVLFHARVGAEHDEEPFDVDDVAAGLVAKLVRRHPHVFADTQVSGAADVARNWDQIKAQERAGSDGAQREHPLDGIPRGMPALARAAKVASRLGRAGEGQWLEEQVAGLEAAGDPGASLLRAVLELRAQDVDADQALRHTLRSVDTAARQRR
ncbi:Nucleoside triphosphate pyrophosphohydrolase MazG [Serinicoccus hydrothermalis]|uniref:Nucleoside triphosphate pyrophosphohydrolase MazG n=1 Tax=Serinicoccus hydrothermalis TaxID=1758689 RepID=A0A1B1NBB6_9MICO|nr:MazG family protein [Serinicoccus hydrothermalis]ANS78728.1 Nucleoside triphosphate pyrophosphohydrolase MazG [Serinicoccus hydrothermalis]